MGLSQMLSIIIPTYEERHNIVPLMEKIFEVTRNGLASTECEVIVVDDNSPDGTGKICEELTDKYEGLKVVIRKEEKGLGSAIKRGILESRGDILAFLDADLSHDPVLIPVLVNQVANGAADIAIASRFSGGGRMISSWRQVWGSKILNWFIRTVLGIPVKDTTGGFLALKRNALQPLNLDTIFTGYGDYCIALLYKGFKKGQRITEVGFTYRPREAGAGKTRFFRAGISYGLRTMKLRMGLE